MHDKPIIRYNYEKDLHTNDHSVEIGSRAVLDTVEFDQSMDIDFNLTQPESRVYSPYENYRFMVHIALHGVQGRANEISTDRQGTLMTSLVSNVRQATFEGQGGIIVGQPNEITGSTIHDNGDEIRTGARASVGDLIVPANNSDYNQIDMRFNATKPIGVMIKRAAIDGHELGDETINASLRDYAAQNNLPIAEVIVLPDEQLPIVLQSEVHENADGTSLLTVIIPGSKEQYYKAQVLRGKAYHVNPEENMAARVLKITAYGETQRTLSDDESKSVVDALNSLVENDTSTVIEEDVRAVRKELL